MISKKPDIIPPDAWQPLLEAPMLLGESPVWEPNEAALYWVDIQKRAVHRFHPESRAHKQWKLPSEPGCIARCEGGGLVVAMRTGLATLNTVDGTLTSIAEAPYDTSRIRFNDGRCDAHGRLWVGTLYEPRGHAGGTLYCVEQGRLRDMQRPATVSNGVAFSIDNRVLYHTDTTAHKITAYDYDLASGNLSGARTFQEFSSDRANNYGGRPDGAAVDSENAYWCAMYEGGRLLRFAASGELLQEFLLPVRCPTMMAFGGPDLRTLYVTTASENRPDDELRRMPLSGCVLTLDIGTSAGITGRLDPPYVV